MSSREPLSSSDAEGQKYTNASCRHFHLHYLTRALWLSRRPWFFFGVLLLCIWKTCQLLEWWSTGNIRWWCYNPLTRSGIGHLGSISDGVGQQGASGQEQGGPGEEKVAHHPCQLLLVEVAPSPAGAPQEERKLVQAALVQTRFYLSGMRAHTHTHRSFMTMMHQQTVTAELLAQ